MSYLLNGLPNNILNKTTENINFISSENGFANKSVPILFTGDKTNEVLLTPATGKRIIIKSMTIICDGNSGVVKILRGNGGVLLPTYVTNQNKGNTSSVLNIKLNTNETIKVTTTGRSEKETFIGITYIEMD